MPKLPDFNTDQPTDPIEFAIKDKETIYNFGVRPLKEFNIKEGDTLMPLFPSKIPFPSTRIDDIKKTIERDLLPKKIIEYVDRHNKIVINANLMGRLFDVDIEWLIEVLSIYYVFERGSMIYLHTLPSQPRIGKYFEFKRRMPVLNQISPLFEEKGINIKSMSISNYRIHKMD